MSDKIKVLYAEDEEALGMIVKDSLESRGFEVTFKTDGASAFRTYEENEYDILVLDVMMPLMDGFSLARKVRQTNKHIPIIFLTAKSQVQDVVEGFELGGNDYLKKPFSVEELIVRIKALIKRKSYEEPVVEEECIIGEYTFSYSKQTLRLKDEERNLTHREAIVLLKLYERRNQVLDRKSILNEVWGDDSFFNARSMDVFITRLRKYLRDDSSIQIVNIRGVGYKLIV
ncbi:response regulator transcription factor [Prolixibacteraceae bacterium JC049]|nr:response regulator transcription factor [Prolixibacteraceae bacterium JC049]